MDLGRQSDNEQLPTADFAAQMADLGGNALEGDFGCL